MGCVRLVGLVLPQALVSGLAPQLVWENVQCSSSWSCPSSAKKHYSKKNDLVSGLLSAKRGETKKALQVSLPISPAVWSLLWYNFLIVLFPTVYCCETTFAGTVLLTSTQKDVVAPFDPASTTDRQHNLNNYTWNHHLPTSPKECFFFKTTG